MSRAAMWSSAARSGAAWMSPHGTEWRSRSASRSSAGVLRGPGRDLVVELDSGARPALRARRTAGRSPAPAGPSRSHSRANTASAFAAITTSWPSAVGYAFGGATPFSTPPLRLRTTPPSSKSATVDSMSANTASAIATSTSWPRAAAMCARGARSACRSRRTARPASRRARCRRGPGGRSASPVVKRMPPDRLADRPEAGLVRPRARSGRSPRRARARPPGFAAASAS